MNDISTLKISSGSKTNKTASDYKEYLTAYRDYTKSKRRFSPGSTAKVDSQFSERLAADVFNFDIDHTKGLDGINLNTKETYEVKASGFANNKVHFNKSNKADHVIWIKVRKDKIEIREIDIDIYNHLDANGFVNINKNKKVISNPIIYTY